MILVIINIKLIRIFSINYKASIILVYYQIDDM